MDKTGKITPLTLDDIANLLGDNSVRPKPVQVGPLRFGLPLGRTCDACGGRTGVSVDGVSYCSTHALYAINQLLLPLEITIHCNCEVGRRTMHSLHTSDCAAYNVAQLEAGLDDH